MSAIIIWDMSLRSHASFSTQLVAAGSQDCEQSVPYHFAGFAGVLVTVLGLWAIDKLGSAAIQRFQSVHPRSRHKRYMKPGSADSFEQRSVTVVNVGREAHRRLTRYRVRTLIVLAGVCALILLVPSTVLFIFSFFFGIVIVLLIAMRDLAASGFWGTPRASSASRVDSVGAGPPLFMGGERNIPIILGLLWPGMSLVGLGLILSLAAGGTVACDETGKTGLLSSRIAVGVGSLVAGLLLVRTARRAASRRSADLLASDSRAPVLYLRSFSSDSMRIRTERWARRTWLDRLTGPERERFEQVVAWHLWSYGPVIAIRRPGGSRQPVGAAREELNQDNWTRQIDEWLVSARLISMTLGHTNGLRWEINRIRELGLHDKLMIVFPPVDEGELDVLWREFQQCWQPEEAISPLPGGQNHTLAATLNGPVGAAVIVGYRHDESNYRLAIETAAQRLRITPQAWDLIPKHGAAKARALPIPLAHPEIRSEVYYLARSNKVIGPFGVMQLRRMASDRMITPETQVTTGGHPWLPVGYIPGIYSRRSRSAALILALLGGILGLDRFYLGKFGTGIAKLMTLAGLGTWWLTDLIALISRQTTDVDGLPLR